jgi:hypothetical protein
VISRREIANEMDGLGMTFHEGDKCGAAAHSFDANGAGSGKQIEKARILDARPENVEQSFSEHIAGGAEPEAFQRFQLP